MRFSSIAIALSAASLASAQLTFNITQALQPGNFKKYRCLYVMHHPSPQALTPLSDNEKLLALMPETTASCLAKCQAAANKADGCAENDFACHCVNYEVYSNVRLRQQQPHPSRSFRPITLALFLFLPAGTSH